MIMLKSTHDRKMAAHVATEAGLLERISRLEIQVKNATELAEMRGRAIRRLEGEIEHQSVNITTLYNENRKLERELRPFKTTRPRGPNGWYLSDAQAAALARQEQAA